MRKSEGAPSSWSRMSLGPSFFFFSEIEVRNTSDASSYVHTKWRTAYKRKWNWAMLSYLHSLLWLVAAPDSNVISASMLRQWRLGLPPSYQDVPRLVWKKATAAYSLSWALPTATVCICTILNMREGRRIFPPPTAALFVGHLVLFSDSEQTSP